MNFKEALIAHLQGEKVEAKDKMETNNWKSFLLVAGHVQIEGIFEISGSAYEFRLKPHTITVNGREIVAGETEAPEAEFFFVDFESPNLWGATCWGGTNLDKIRLQRGLVHLTRENAIAHAKAMLGID